jgi:hypothetical protein
MAFLIRKILPFTNDTFIQNNRKFAALKKDRNAVQP